MIHLPAVRVVVRDAPPGQPVTVWLDAGSGPGLELVIPPEQRWRITRRGDDDVLMLMPEPAAAGAAVGVALAAALLPALGAALSGALIGGARLGVIGLGAWLLKEEPVLKAAASSLTGTMSKSGSADARPAGGRAGDA